VRSDRLGVDPDRAAVRETVYRLDGPLRWALGENYELVERLAVVPGRRVLDIGAGTGYLTLPLAERVGTTGRVDAVDASEDLLEVLARKAEKSGLAGRIVCTVGRACELPFADETFDCVSSSYLLHELADRAQEALVEMHRVLKPLGRVVLADYRRIEDQERWREIEAWYGAQADGAGPDEVHLRFDLAEMERMLLRAGFQDVELTTWKSFHMHATARR
jgi:ubiquinone/menaquinone biosynthesis C-methylase UbiE